MYRVVLCEDEKVFAKAQEKTCHVILQRLNIEYSITVFESSADFLSAFFDQGMRFDLMLLDIIMQGIDGMTLAKRVREEDKTAGIIFITSSRDYALEGYDVNALHYLVKPLDEATLARLIEAEYNKRFNTDYFVFDSACGKVRVAAKDIVCAETMGRRVEITLGCHQTAYYGGTLTELLAKLPKDQFVRCHQSYAVNILNVRELIRREAIALNGHRIPVSRTFAKAVQQTFLQKLRQM